MVSKALIGMSCVMASLVSVSASAALIDGEISLDGGFTPVDVGWAATSINLATGLDFDGGSGGMQDGGVGSAVQATGDFIGSVGTNNVTMTDFQFNPLSPNPVTVWSVNGFGFSMTSVSTVFQNSTYLLLTGEGMVSKVGFENTLGTWEFSSQTSGETFSWSSSSATVVPVPAAVWLFGSGLLGLVGVARRKK